MTKLCVVYHSGYGHTEKQAQAVIEGIESFEGAQAILIPVDTIDQHWDDLHQADAIIFGSPTYMGSVSAPFKEFMDKTSKIWHQQQWKNKLAAGFTNSGSQSGDKLNTLIQLSIFAAQHAMIWVGLDILPGHNSSKGSTQDLNRLGSFLGAMSQSDVDASPESAPIESDLKTAAHLGHRVACLVPVLSKNQID